MILDSKIDPAHSTQLPDRGPVIITTTIPPEGSVNETPKEKYFQRSIMLVDFDQSCVGKNVF